MAKNIKSLQIVIYSQDGTEFTNAVGHMELGSTDDPGLSKVVVNAFTLTSQQLTDLEDILETALQTAKTEHGV